MRYFRVSGQYLWELALCISVITAAILGIQIYVQRNIQARYKAGVISGLFSPIENEAIASGIPRLMGIPQQYIPYYRESEVSEVKNSDLIEGFPTSSIDETINRSGWQETNLPTAGD